MGEDKALEAIWDDTTMAVAISSEFGVHSGRGKLDIGCGATGAEGWN